MEQTEKIMTRVEALLRKAESTNFGPESEVLIAKAHELMLRYGIEEAMLHKAAGVKDDIIVHTIPVRQRGAVAQERHVLLGQVAKWQRCRAIITGDTMSIVGYKRDTEFVRVLYESLVLQMMESMLADTDRTDSWNRSFCRGFVTTVSDRLEQVYRKVEGEVAEEGSSTALVLRDRSAAVEEYTDKIFPDLRTSRMKSMTMRGDAFEKGRVAGQNADVGVTKLGPNRKELR